MKQGASVKSAAVEIVRVSKAVKEQQVSLSAMG